MSIYMILSLIFFLLCLIGLWKIFEKAGEKGWAALIPFFNLYVWLRVIRKPIWWYIFLLIPFINVFVILLMIVEVLKCFSKHGLGAQALGVLFPFFYLPYLGFSPKEKYTDPTKAPPVVKSATREWLDAIIFAVIAASIIRIFLIEAYTIPTSSMEKTLLVGDYLFVSKVNFGPRVPNTPLSFPFVHHTLPLTENVKSYLEWIQLPYYRFPGYTKVKNLDVVVFNYPDGDTLSTKFQSNVSYYQLVRAYGRDAVWNDSDNFGKIIARPVDKRENFIKRCIGTPGDIIEIRNKIVYINGKPEENRGIKEYKYIVRTDGSAINSLNLEKLGVTEDILTDNRGAFEMTLTEESAQKIGQFANVRSVEPVIESAGDWNKDMFPHDSNFRWNIDNYGPIAMPRKGETVALTPVNIALYKRIIDVFEGNDLRIEGEKIFINGKETSSYTFKMDYYWMMGDNRHNSADSRYWGFVPEDHIVGEAVFVWFSMDPRKSLLDGKIRFSKLWRIVN